VDLKTTSLAHLDDVLAEWKRLQSIHGAECEELGDAEGMRFIGRARAVIRRVAGQNSTYAHHADEIVKQSGYPGYVARNLAGVVESLHADVAAGFVGGMAELVRGDLFADFLEMAQHLLDEQYKDAAAVIAGSSLEAHLRQLCAKHGVSTDVVSSNGTRPKKAEQMNSDLAAATVYSKLDQKNVTAWLDLRNNAAHGKYAEYQAPQVALLIAGARDFMARNPA
jgi:hypothetical protein